MPANPNLSVSEMRPAGLPTNHMPDGWKCQKCSILNKESSLFCYMCNTMKGGQVELTPAIRPIVEAPTIPRSSTSAYPTPGLPAAPSSSPYPSPGNSYPTMGGSYPSTAPPARPSTTANPYAAIGMESGGFNSGASPYGTIGGRMAATDKYCACGEKNLSTAEICQRCYQPI